MVFLGVLDIVRLDHTFDSLLVFFERVNQRLVLPKHLDLLMDVVLLQADLLGDAEQFRLQQLQLFIQSLKMLQDNPDDFSRCIEPYGVVEAFVPSFFDTGPEKLVQKESEVDFVVVIVRDSLILRLPYLPN